METKRVLIVEPNMSEADSKVLINELYGNGKLQGYEFLVESAVHPYGGISPGQVISRVENEINSEGLDAVIVAVNCFDWSDPSQFGLELTERIRAANPSLPILAAYDSKKSKKDRETNKKILALGADELMFRYSGADKMKEILDKYCKE